MSYVKKKLNTMKLCCNNEYFCNNEDVSTVEPNLTASSIVRSPLLRPYISL